MPSAVCLEACNQYELIQVRRAVETAMARLGWFEGLPSDLGRRVLLKPNMLAGVSPDRAVTTHPAVVEAVTALFVERGFDVSVGDSPAVDGTLHAARKNGIAAAVERAGGRLVDFAETVDVPFPEGVMVKRFTVAKPLLDADIVVTIPKLKTHGQMYYTGAIKNLFGCVVGLQKSQYHLRFIERKAFARMIVDLARLVKPRLAIMDAVVAMEGVGPMDGRPKSLGFIGVSADPLALDWAAASLIGYDPRAIPILAEALTRGAPWMERVEDIEYLAASLEEFRPASFARVSIPKDIAFLRGSLPGFAYRFLRNILVPRPRFDARSCIRCGKCINICAAGALSFDRKGEGARIVFEKEKCIQCYCCHEVCPVHAISLHRNLSIS